MRRNLHSKASEKRRKSELSHTVSVSYSERSSMMLEVDARFSVWTLRMRGCIGASGGALPQVSDRDGEWQAGRILEGHQGGSPPYKNAIDIMNAYISA